MTIEELVQRIKEHPTGLPGTKEFLDSLPDDEMIKLFLHHPSLGFHTVPSLEKAKKAALGAFDLEDWVNILKP